MESIRHQRLKLLSLAFLRAAGCSAAAVEVRCPASRYRTDAGGHADPLRRGERDRNSQQGGFCLRTAGRPTTVLVECKQSRADFLRDSRWLDSLLAERARLDDDRRHLEQRLIRASEPHLRGGGSMLFPEMETWDFASSRSPGYLSVLRELRRLDKQLHGDTKFWTIARYALADALLIAAPVGMIRAAEVPPGWELLEFPPEWLDGPGAEGTYSGPLCARLRRAGAGGGSSGGAVQEKHRARLLRNIAVAASSRLAAEIPPPRITIAP